MSPSMPARSATTARVGTREALLEVGDVPDRGHACLRIGCGHSTSVAGAGYDLAAMPEPPAPLVAAQVRAGRPPRRAGARRRRHAERLRARRRAAPRCRTRAPRSRCRRASSPRSGRTPCPSSSRASSRSRRTTCLALVATSATRPCGLLAGGRAQLRRRGGPPRLRRRDRRARARAGRAGGRQARLRRVPRHGSRRAAARARRALARRDRHRHADLRPGDGARGVPPRLRDDRRRGRRLVIRRPTCTRRRSATSRSSSAGSSGPTTCSRRSAAERGSIPPRRSTTLRHAVEPRLPGSGWIDPRGSADAARPPAT